MRCPQCLQEGRKSVLRMAGGGFVTAMWTSPYYDEEGQYHFHDPNQMCEGGQCSNGHELVLIHGNKCGAPGCTYGEASVLKLQPTNAGLRAGRAE